MTGGDSCGNSALQNRSDEENEVVPTKKMSLMCGIFFAFEYIFHCRNGLSKAKL